MRTDSFLRHDDRAPRISHVADFLRPPIDRVRVRWVSLALHLPRILTVKKRGTFLFRHHPCAESVTLLGDGQSGQHGRDKGGESQNRAHLPSDI